MSPRQGEENGVMLSKGGSHIGRGGWKEERADQPSLRPGLYSRLV